MLLNLGGKEHCILSTEKASNDLLRERGNIYSSREQFPAAAQLLSGGLRPLFWPYGDRWRRGRKLQHHFLMQSAAKTYQATYLLESMQAIHDLTLAPHKYEDVFYRFAAGIIFRIAFGKTLNGPSRSFLPRVLKVVHTVERVGSPGAYLVDTLPFMLRIPKFLAPFKQELEQLHDEELLLFRELLEDVRQDMALNKSPPCFERTFLENKDKYGLTDDEGAYVVGAAFEAGASTTAGSLMSFTLAMVTHPEWFARMQQEVDQVVGTERLPVFEDIPNLPIMRAIMKEVLRWRPTAAGGIPHKLTQDDVYEGMFLRAGTIVHANQWAIHREPALYPDPETFNPSRWLEPDYPTYKEPLSIYPNLQNYSAFGVGRRICAGQNVAEPSMYIVAARIAWSFDLSKARDRDGREIEVPLNDFTSGLMSQPNRFRFALKNRSKERADIAQQAFEEEMRNDPLAGR